jgi:V/A-type H+-transporting ATPase subunit I
MSVNICQPIKIVTKPAHALEVLAYLQNISQKVEIAKKTDASPIPEKYTKNKTKLEKNLTLLTQCLDIVNLNAQKTSPLAALFDNRIALTPKTLKSYTENTPKILDKAKTLLHLVAKKEQLILKTTQDEELLNRVTPLKEIDIDILGEFRYIALIPFLVDEKRSQNVSENIKLNLKDIELASIKKLDKEYLFVVAIEKNRAKEAADYISNYATVLHFEQKMQGSFQDLYNITNQNLHTYKTEIQDLDKEILTYTKYQKHFLILKDITKSELNLYYQLHNAFYSKKNHTVYFKGWIEEQNFDKFSNKITKHFGKENIEILLQEKSKEERVTITNTPFVKNFESVTRIMGLPVGKALDPTPFLSFFFILMFGLALSEAGYGVVLFLVTGILLLQPNLKQSLRPMLSVIFFCSISTIIVGALTGSWFGLVPDQVVFAESLPHTKILYSLGIIPVLQTLHIIDPLAKVVLLMVMMSSLGIIHLTVGSFIAFAQSIKQGTPLKGLFLSLSWVGLIVLGLTFYFSGLEIVKNILLGYLILMIPMLGWEAPSIPAKIASGLFNMFFGLIGYISDSLSYTRLVALGLATGIIAGVINTLAVLSGEGLVEKGGVSLIIGYLIMTVIFIFGHLFNIALNVLGTYINVGRLHFVEFFNKFFESGGIELKPLKRTEEFIKVINNN